MSLDRARILTAKTLTVSFIVAKPMYTFLGRTMVGAADRDDGAERGAVLLGRRLDVKEGERLTSSTTGDCFPFLRLAERLFAALP